MDDYLISLDDEYFRDKTKVVAFKYGGKMTLLGHLTNIVNNDVNSDESNIFSTFPQLLIRLCLHFLTKANKNCSSNSNILLINYTLTIGRWHRR